MGDNQKELSFSDHTHNLPDLDGVLPATSGGTGYTSLNDLKTALNISSSLQVIILTNNNKITKNHYYGGVISMIVTSSGTYPNYLGNAAVCGTDEGTYRITTQGSGSISNKRSTSLNVSGSGPYTLSFYSDLSNGKAIVFVSD